MNNQIELRADYSALDSLTIQPENVIITIWEYRKKNQRIRKKKKKLTGTIADYPLVEVKWNDATGDAGWHDINKAMLSKPAKPVSLGYKLLQTKEKIIIFTDYIVDEEDGTLTVGNVSTIPAAWVQDVTEIEFKD